MSKFGDIAVFDSDLPRDRELPVMVIVADPVRAGCLLAAPRRGERRDRLVVGRRVVEVEGHQPRGGHRVTARYWTPTFGTVLRHSTGQTVMLIGRVAADLPAYAQTMLLGGPTIMAASRPGSIGVKRYRSDTYEWERIKAGRDE